MSIDNKQKWNYFQKYITNYVYFEKREIKQNRLFLHKKPTFWPKIYDKKELILFVMNKLCLRRKRLFPNGTDYILKWDGLKSPNGTLHHFSLIQYIRKAHNCFHISKCRNWTKKSVKKALFSVSTSQNVKIKQRKVLKKALFSILFMFIA